MPRPRLNGNVARARKLRATMSLPEVLLWRVLKTQTLARFRRQYPIGPYVLDF